MRTEWKPLLQDRHQWPTKLLEPLTLFLRRAPASLRPGISNRETSNGGEGLAPLGFVDMANSVACTAETAVSTFLPFVVHPYLSFATSDSRAAWLGADAEKFSPLVTTKAEIAPEARLSHLTVLP